jgi:hypothetical protein
VPLEVVADYLTFAPGIVNDEYLHSFPLTLPKVVSDRGTLYPAGHLINQILLPQHILSLT